MIKDQAFPALSNGAGEEEEFFRSLSRLAILLTLAAQQKTQNPNQLKHYVLNVFIKFKVGDQCFPLSSKRWAS